MHLLSNLGKLKLEHHNFKVCLGYIARTCFLSHKEQTNKQTITKIQEVCAGVMTVLALLTQQGYLDSDS